MALDAVSRGEAAASALDAVSVGEAPDGVAAGAGADGVDMAGERRLASGLALPQQAETTRPTAAMMAAATRLTAAMAAAAAAAAAAKAETAKGKGKPKGPLARDHTTRRLLGRKASSD